MASKEKFKKQQKDKSRLETLRSFMFSFSLTVGAIVVAAVLIPKSPIAKIENVSIFQNQVVYQIEVTDEEHALDLSTLRVVLDGQLETHTHSLNLGINVGIFENLRPNTSYYLQVYGSKGFGEERLASQRLVTKAGSGGAIISYELMDSFDFYLNYQVNVLLNDDEGLYSEVNLYYAYIFPDETNVTYDFISILESNQMIELFDVPSEHTQIHLRLEATLAQGETILLDELRFYVPFKLQTDLYLYQISSSRIQYQFYEDYYYTEDIQYQAKLYFNHMLLREVDIKTDEYSQHYHESSIDFQGLKRDTTYRIILTATYVNPYTKRTETTILHEEEITTLGSYEVQYEMTDYETYIEVYIYVEDPNHYFQVPYYEIYDIVDGQLYYLDSNLFWFTREGEGKYSILIIDKPSVSSYQLVIGIMNQNNYSINHIIIDQTIKN